MSSTQATPGFKRAYTSARPDVLALVPASVRCVLDVGCSNGALGAALKQRSPGTVVRGIELDPTMAAAAADVLDEVVQGDLGAVELPCGPYDCIICADILEHLADPWALLRRLVEQLDPQGSVVLSLPNVGHLDTLVNVFFRRTWPYRTRGIHDATHVRFFARRNIEALLGEAGLVPVAMRRNLRLREAPSRLNRLAPLVAIPGLRDLLTFQFVVLARPGMPPPAGPWTSPPRPAA